METITKWKVFLILVASLALTVSIGGIGPSPAFAWGDWRMTGGGSFFYEVDDIEYSGKAVTSEGGRVTHGFEIHCMQPAKDNLQIVDHSTKLNFHLEGLTFTDCFMDDAYIPDPPPGTQFNTFIGRGYGRCNIPGGGKFDCFIEFKFIDGGEPGGCERDYIDVLITDEPGLVLLHVPFTGVDCGNHQAHGVDPY